MTKQTRICSECGKEKDVWEYYDRYARCKQCTREDQNATNWYKQAQLLPFEQWPEALQHYTIVRHEHMSQGRSVPAIAKDMVLAYQLSLGDDPNEPTEVSLPVVVALHRQVMALKQQVEELKAGQQTPKVDHVTRTMIGELNNSYKAACKEVDDWVSQGRLDPMDAADIKEGMRLLNQALEHELPMPAKGILNCVLTLAQLQLPMPTALESMYTKYYKPALVLTGKPERQRVEEIAGVNLYEYDWLQFLQEA